MAGKILKGSTQAAKYPDLTNRKKSFRKGKGIIVSLKNLKLGLIILIEMSWIAAQIVMGI